VSELKPPFRADHVGSLLRPKALSDAREGAQRGEVSPDELRGVEDQAIRAVVALQESVGMHSITDGEFRRTAWHTDFLTGFEGIEATGAHYAVSFRDNRGREEKIGTMLQVVSRIRRRRPIMIDHFKFVKSVTRRTAKFSIPSPTYLHLRGGCKDMPQALYGDIEEFWDDIIRGYKEEIADLAAAGCTYLQLDDVSIAFLCDENIRAQSRRDGENPDLLPGKYASVINAILQDRPAGLTVTMHTCRGNHRSLWMAQGSYEAVAEEVFTQVKVDGFFLEFDSERAGGFEPLRFVSPNKRVVLGLVSSKIPQLESKDELKRRIDAAARVVPLENLCISPQCGFASTAVGNQLTEDDERRKLELIVQVAAETWGSMA
jgi:5-methyltetrahydropteroyltriglutamate--homocysteine methyltransferase